MKLTVPPLEIDPNEGFSPSKDIFGRKRFGTNLINLIENINDELVIAIDAPWGEGKTTFIKMWRGMLVEEGIQSIYFDAFENDYQEDPFLAIAAEIYNIIDDEKPTEKSRFKQKTISALKTLAKAGLRIGIKTATAGILDETIFDETGTIKDVSTEASNLLDSYVSQRLESAKQDKKNLSDFKQSLDQLASSIGNDKPLVFIIDELDRCKPPFALAILENIKHLYSVKNIVFVLVMNRTQIEESVRCQYGAGVEASKYLQKFVHLWASLPKNKHEHKCDNSNYLLDCLERMDFPVTLKNEQESINFFKELARHYDLSLREIERSLTNYSLIYNIEQGNLSIGYRCIQAYLSIIKVINFQTYDRIFRKNISYEELVTQTHLHSLQPTGAFPITDEHYLRVILRLCLSSREEIENWIKDSSIEQSQRQQLVKNSGDIKHALNDICGWFNVLDTTL